MTVFVYFGHLFPSHLIYRPMQKVATTTRIKDIHILNNSLILYEQRFRSHHHVKISQPAKVLAEDQRYIEWMVKKPKL